MTGHLSSPSPPSEPAPPKSSSRGVRGAGSGGDGPCGVLPPPDLTLTCTRCEEAVGIHLVAGAQPPNPTRYVCHDCLMEP